MTKSAYTTLDWYQSPKYYDIIFDVDSKREADFLEALYQLYASPGKRRALEPACGSGRLVVELARRGWRVSGSDLEPAMLDYARKRLREAGLRASLTQADMANFRLQAPVDLAHCLVSTFKYLLEEESASAHLRCVARALRPGGIYVLGFHLSDYADKRTTRERWLANRGDTQVVCNIHGWPADRQQRREQVRSRLIVQEKGRELRSETCWQFRTYNAREVRALLARVPELEHVATYDFTYDLSAPRKLDDSQLDIILVLRKGAERRTSGALKPRS